MQETKRSRGRPPTGKRRTVQLNIDVTAEEKEEIKKAVKQHQKKGVADLLLSLIRN